MGGKFLLTKYKIQLKKSFLSNTESSSSRLKLTAKTLRTDQIRLKSYFFCKMATSRRSSSVSLDSICGGPTWINLPKEMWERIWSFLDYNALQNFCTLVSKTWLENIRDSPTLSGELILKISESDPSVEVIKDILSHWTKLKVLHFKTNQDTLLVSISVRFGVNS